MATPLGLGKPNPLINALYRKFKSDPSRELRIFTALSLAVPHASGEMQARSETVRGAALGEDYPELEYLKGTAPAQYSTTPILFTSLENCLTRPETQRDYISVNYTHVTSAILEQGVNLIVQMIAKSPRGLDFTL